MNAYMNVEVSQLKPGMLFLLGEAHVRVASVVEPRGQFTIVRGTMDLGTAVVLRKKTTALVQVRKSSIAP